MNIYGDGNDSSRADRRIQQRVLGLMGGGAGGGRRRLAVGGWRWEWLGVGFSHEIVKTTREPSVISLTPQPPSPRPRAAKATSPLGPGAVCLHMRCNIAHAGIVVAVKERKRDAWGRAFPSLCTPHSIVAGVGQCLSSQSNVCLCLHLAQ